MILLPGVVSAQKIGKTISFSTDVIECNQYIKHETSFEKVSMKESFHSLDIGKPDLPVYYYKFYIPKGLSVTGATFKSTGEYQLQLVSDLAPVQHPVKLSVDDQDTTFDEPDPAVYKMDAFYPEDRVQVVHSDLLDGDLEIATIAFYPMQYNFAKTIDICGINETWESSVAFI